MEVTWQVAALWIGMALIASLLSVRLGMSVVSGVRPESAGSSDMSLAR